MDFMFKAIISAFNQKLKALHIYKQSFRYGHSSMVKFLLAKEKTQVKFLLPKKLKGWKYYVTIESGKFSLILKYS